VATTKRQSDARQRILETADRLFYAEGIHAVGVDRIIAEAPVAKMTLYNHFKSKDDLVLAVLQHREKQILAAFRASMEKDIDAGATPLDALFNAFRGWLEGRDFRGCLFINTTVDLANATHPASRYAAGHKRTFQKIIADAVRETWGKAGEKHVPALALLFEGAIVTAHRTPGDAGVIAETARAAAHALLGKPPRMTRR